MVSSLLRDIKLSEVLGTEMNPLTNKVKDFVDNKLEELIQFESEKYPNSIFYKKDDIILFRQDLKNERLWCSYKHYWSFFKEEIGLNYNEIQELTMALVGTHLNYKQFTPVFLVNMERDLVGTHLNYKQFTPLGTTTNIGSQVGTHLNCKQFTPCCGAVQ